MRRGLALAVVITACIVPSRADGAVRYVHEVFGGYTKTSDLVYGNAEGQDLHLDLYEPTGDTAAKRAVFIWAHGGGFSGGDKADINSAPSLSDHMTKRGWVTLSVNYRLDPTLPGGGIPGYVQNPDAVQRGIRAVRDAQHDIQAAVRWARANALAYRLDPDRIAIGGQSAGATAAMAVAYNSDDPGDSGNPGYSSLPQAAIGTGTGNLPFADVHPDPLVEPAVGMFHGQDDSSMPFVVPLATCLVARALLNTCEFKLYSGKGHDMHVGMRDWPYFLHKYAIKLTKAPLHQDQQLLPAIPRVPFEVLDLNG